MVWGKVYLELTFYRNQNLFSTVKVSIYKQLCKTVLWSERSAGRRSMVEARDATIII